MNIELSNGSESELVGKRVIVKRTKRAEYYAIVGMHGNIKYLYENKLQVVLDDIFGNVGPIGLTEDDVEIIN